MKDTPYRCTVCGRFIGYGEANIITDFTPDSAYGPEEISMRHSNCTIALLSRDQNDEGSDTTGDAHRTES
jgi:hypothetical protein